jgi:ribose/xylose/arabinose/galactoside ABC-type transport system permease subunit
LNNVARFALPFLLVFVFAAFAVMNPRFMTATNIENILAGYSFLAILAIGQTFPILARGIDISIGSIVAVVAMTIFDLIMLFGCPGWLALMAGLAVGAGLGLLNGALIVWLRLQPFVATLATLAAYRGVVYAISGRQIRPELGTTPITDPAIKAMDWYMDMSGLAKLLGIKLPWLPVSFLLLVIVALASAWLLNRTRFGLDLRSVGGNRDAAFYAGINVPRILLIAYMLSGLSGAIAAIILVGRFTTATEALGSGMELTAISACVVGGVSLQGGRGNILGPILGTFLQGIILIGLTIMGISQYVQLIIVGAILVGAVLYDRILSDHAARARPA